MSDDTRHIHPNSPVHSEHWCGHEGCTKWGSFGKERGGGSNRMALLGTPGNRLFAEWAAGTAQLSMRQPTLFPPWSLF
jgi:hypothetical protein